MLVEGLPAIILFCITVMCGTPGRDDLYSHMSWLVQNKQPPHPITWLILTNWNVKNVNITKEWPKNLNKYARKLLLTNAQTKANITKAWFGAFCALWPGNGSGLAPEVDTRHHISMQWFKCDCYDVTVWNDWKLEVQHRQEADNCKLYAENQTSLSGQATPSHTNKVFTDTCNVCPVKQRKWKTNACHHRVRQNINFRFNFSKNIIIHNSSKNVVNYKNRKTQTTHVTHKTSLTCTSDMEPGNKATWGCFCIYLVIYTNTCLYQAS